MSIKQIIQESINQNPMGLKEALAEELRSRVGLALEAKMEDVRLDEAASFDAVIKAHQYKPSGTNNYVGIGGCKITHRGDHVVSYNEADGRKVHKNPSSLNTHLNSVHDHEVSLKSLKEETDQLDELKKSTLASYTRKAASSAASKAVDLGQKRADADEVDRFTNRHMPNKFNVRDDMKKAVGADSKSQDKLHNKIGRRLQGIDRATARLAKESFDQIDEAIDYHYYVTNNTVYKHEAKLLHSKAKPFATEKDALVHIKNQGGRQDGVIHKVHAKTGKIVSNRGVANGQPGYSASDDMSLSFKHLRELPQ